MSRRRDRRADRFYRDGDYRDGRSLQRRQVPRWLLTLRRWVPWLDPTTHLMAAGVLAAEWAGPGLVSRLFDQLLVSLGVS